MGSFTVDVSDDVEQNLRRFTEESARFENPEDLLGELLEIRMENYPEDLDRIPVLIEEDRYKEALEALESAEEDIKRAQRRISELVDPPELSEDASEQVEKSRQDFESGDFTVLEKT